MALIEGSYHTIIIRDHSARSLWFIFLKIKQYVAEKFEEISQLRETTAR